MPSAAAKLPLGAVGLAGALRLSLSAVSDEGQPPPPCSLFATFFTFENFFKYLMILDCLFVFEKEALKLILQACYGNGRVGQLMGFTGFFRWKVSLSPRDSGVSNWGSR